MNLLKKIYEHLITKKKYHTLQNDYATKSKEYDDKVIENDQLRRQQKIIKNVWEETLIEQEEEIIALKKQIKESKKKKIKESSK